MSNIGSGIFMWDGVERRSGRYGFIYLSKSNYEETAHCVVSFDTLAVKALLGKKVHMYAVVIENRESSHLGDAFLQINPSTPVVGERVELGVGILAMQNAAGHPEMIGLAPIDHRQLFWFDPRQLYRLHDQTVDLFINETDEPVTPAPCIKIVNDANIVGLGSGSIQVRHYGQVGELTGIKLDANITQLDDNTMLVERPSCEKGCRIAGTVSVKS